ncbi:MAG: hypothetical protein WC948_06430, partial [Thermovirgaceae bacterium]
IETFRDTTLQKKASLILFRSASGLRALHEIIREISGEKTVPSSSNGRSSCSRRKCSSRTSRYWKTRPTGGRRM